MYNPFEDIRSRAENSAQTGARTLSGYTPAWEEHILNKNLFDQMRSYLPPPVIANVPPPPPPKKPELALKGIIINLSGDFVAYIEKDREKPVAVIKGDRLDDVDVIDITEKTVNLKWMDEEIKLSMEKVQTLKR